MPAKLKTYASDKDVKHFEDINRLYIRAGAHSRARSRKEGEKTRHIEAFLLQAALLEGVLVSLGLKSLEKRLDLSALEGKRKKQYRLDNVINDLYLLGDINTDEFKKLEQFKAKRNVYIHNLLSDDVETVEVKVLHIYKEYDDLVRTMIKLLKKKIGRIPKIKILKI